MAGSNRLATQQSPKQSLIVEQIRRRIIEGEYTRGAQIPPVNELAAIHNVSTQTVQNAMDRLRSSGYIETIKRIGNFVSVAPPHLCQFGIVFPDEFRPEATCSQYTRAWHAEVQRLLRLGTEPGGAYRRISFFYCSDTADGARNREELARRVLAHEFAGLIFPFNSETYWVKNDPSLPVVIVGHTTGEDRAVGLDFAGVLEKGMKYLATRGRRRLAAIAVANLAGQHSESFRIRAQAMGFPVERRWVHSVGLANHEAVANCAELLASTCGPNGPDALLVLDDNLLPGVSDGLLAAGVRVPDDIEVVSHCNFPYPVPARIPVKRVGYDIRRLVAACIERIEAGRRGEQLPSVLIPALLEDELQDDTADDYRRALQAPGAH